MSEHDSLSPQGAMYLARMAFILLGFLVSLAHLFETVDYNLAVVALLFAITGVLATHE
jgi:uncharacterized integral membrane protein